MARHCLGENKVWKEKRGAVMELFRWISWQRGMNLRITITKVYRKWCCCNMSLLCLSPLSFGVPMQTKRSNMLEFATRLSGGPAGQQNMGSSSPTKDSCPSLIWPWLGPVHKSENVLLKFCGSLDSLGISLPSQMFSATTRNKIKCFHLWPMPSYLLALFSHFHR